MKNVFRNFALGILLALPGVVYADMTGLDTNYPECCGSICDDAKSCKTCKLLCNASCNNPTDEGKCHASCDSHAPNYPCPDKADPVDADTL